MNIWNQNVGSGRFWEKHHSLFYCNAVCKPAPHQQCSRHAALCNPCLSCCWSWICLEPQPRSQSVLQPLTKGRTTWHRFASHSSLPEIILSSGTMRLNLLFLFVFRSPLLLCAAECSFPSDLILGERAVVDMAYPSHADTGCVRTAVRKVSLFS